MRGGGRLVNECSWISGICFRLHHSTEKSETFSHRHPSSASLAGSEVPSSLAASPRGKPRGRRLKLLPFTEPLYPRNGRAASSRPYPVRWKPGAGGANLAKYEHNPRKMSNGMVDDSDFFRYNGYTTTQIVGYSLKIYRKEEKRRAL